MKIIHVIPSLRKGGAERICLDIVREMRRCGHAVDVVTLSPGYDYETEYPDIHPIGIDSYVTPSLSGPWQVDLTQWNKVMSEKKPDVIHSHLFLAEMVSRYELIPGVRYFTHCHDNMHQLDNFSLNTLFDKAKLTEFYEKQFIIKQYKKCSNQFIAISANTKAYFERSLPQSLAGHVTLLHNAINFDLFNKAAHERPASPLRLINIGSFVPKKNQVYLVEVARQMADMGINLRMTMLGDGPQRPVVNQKIKEYKLEAIVNAPGNVNNVAEYLSQANVYVHSATYEPFGLVLVEAMAAGLPVISLDGGGNRDLVINNKTGYMMPDGDIRAFCSKIIGLSQDQALYNGMSDNAIKFAERFDIKTYVGKLLTIYNI